MKTKNWSYIILALYFIINILLVTGVSYFLIEKGEANFRATDYLSFGLVVAAIMFLCQFVLFDLKVEVVEKRPVAKRKITPTAIFIALLMAFITYFLFFTVLFVAFGEGKENPLGTVEWLFGFLLIFVFIASWIFWSYIFLNMGRKQEPAPFIKNSMNMLIKGSVLELLVAIPSHIIMRNRDDCCAPIFSYMGIITGASVLLFAFGPGIIFLFYHRMQAKKARLRQEQGIID